MSLTAPALDQLYGAASVRGADGVSAGAAGFWRAGRITATARTGAGVYTATLDPGLDTGESLVSANLNVAGVAADDIYAFQTSDTNIAIVTFRATVATDLNFKVWVRQVRVGT